MIAAILGLVIATGPTEEAIDVRWSAPEGCPDEAEVRRRVMALLEGSGSGRREPVALAMTVTATEGGFELRVVAGAEGERVVTGLDCGDVAEAGVLIAAIAIDPDLVPPPPDLAIPEPSAKSESESGSESESEPASESESESEAESESGPRRRALVPVVEGGLGIGFGRLASPLPMAYGRFGGGFEIRRFRFLARLSGFGPSFDIPFGVANPGGVFGLGTIGIAPCVQSLGSRWRVVACVATDIGLAGGRGRNTANDQSARSVWWGIEGELGVEYAIRPTLALALRVDGGGVPASPNMRLETLGPLCCEEWGAGLRLGVVGKFGEGERVR